MTRWLWLLPVAVALAVWFGTSGNLARPTPGAGTPVAATVRDPESTPARGASGEGPASAATAPARLRVSVVARYAHDPGAFTQGLLWHGGKLYESTGQYGESRLRRWDLESGEVEQEISLEPSLFGEGLALVDSDSGRELIWLTWKAGRALRFDLGDFASLGEFSYESEGWGLTLCHGELYRSDGTATLWRHDPETFAVRGRFQVLLEGVPVELLNELECTPRGILANVLYRDQILRIDPRSGRVTATIDAGGLRAPGGRVAFEVLNGIAYRPETDTVLLTGKYWPWLFEVVLEKG
ncbi:MAG: glutaminyl-peptide cyclotransferase [bacterium]|nr:glutaminyl-peptide cyclotransferase [bacterium]